MLLLAGLLPRGLMFDEWKTSIEVSLVSRKGEDAKAKTRRLQGELAKIGLSNAELKSEREAKLAFVNARSRFMLLSPSKAAISVISKKAPIEQLNNLSAKAPNLSFRYKSMTLDVGFDDQDYQAYECRKLVKGKGNVAFFRQTDQIAFQGFTEDGSNQYVSLQLKPRDKASLDFVLSTRQLQQLLARVRKSKPQSEVLSSPSVNGASPPKRKVKRKAAKRKTKKRAKAKK